MPSNEPAYLDPIAKIFQNAGYRIDSPGRIKGDSGVTHQVDLLCSSDDGKVLLDIREDHAGVGPFSVITLLAKMIDLGNAKAALIAIPKALPLTKKISVKQGFTLVEAESVQQAAAFLKQNMLRVLSPHRASAAVPSEKGDVDVDIVRVQGRYSRKVRTRALKSALDLLILLTLNQTTLTGYDVIATIYSKFKVLLSPGTVYPILNNLKREGLITGVIQDRKKIYVSTQAGRLVSNIAMQEYEAIQSELLSHLRMLEGNKSELPQRQQNRSFAPIR